MISRRAFLTASAGTAVGLGGAAFALPQASLACDTLHKAMAVKILEAEKSFRMASSNVLTNLRDMTCPCCGDPFTLFKDIDV